MNVASCTGCIESGSVYWRTSLSMTLMGTREALDVPTALAGVAKAARPKTMQSSSSALDPAKDDPRWLSFTLINRIG